MTESEFTEALAEFTSKSGADLQMSDVLADVGVDSIGVFEFLMKIEDVVGSDATVDESISTVQDLYDAVQDMADANS